MRQKWHAWFGICLSSRNTTVSVDPSSPSLADQLKDIHYSHPRCLPQFDTPRILMLSNLDIHNGDWSFVPGVDLTANAILRVTTTTWTWFLEPVCRLCCRYRPSTPVLIDNLLMLPYAFASRIYFSQCPPCWYATQNLVLVGIRTTRDSPTHYVGITDCGSLKGVDKIARLLVLQTELHHAREVSSAQSDLE